MVAVPAEMPEQASQGGVNAEFQSCSAQPGASKTSLVYSSDDPDKEFSADLVTM